MDESTSCASFAEAHVFESARARIRHRLIKKSSGKAPEVRYRRKASTQALGTGAGLPY